MLQIDIDSSKVSDGNHTFEELYTHRNLLYLAFLKEKDNGWRAKKHYDNTQWKDWFIVGCYINNKQISYHLPIELWEYADFLATYDKAPHEWDGHTADDVIDRLKSYLLSSDS